MSLTPMLTNMATTTTPLLPTSSSSVAPIPTVIPGGKPIYQEVQNTGKRTLWVVTVLMGLSSVVFYVLTARVPLSKRVFHTLVSLTTTISFLSYLAMTTGEGMVYKHAEIIQTHKHVPNVSHEFFRQIQIPRYINWLLTSPLLLLNMSLLSGLAGAHLLPAISADVIMFATGMLGSFAARPASRWVWFTLSCLAYLVTVYQIGMHGQRAAGNKEPQTRRFFGSLVAVTLLVKALYPITLAAGPLALRMSVDSEIVMFAILDIFTQGLLGYWIIIAHDGSPGISLNVDGFWAHGIGNEGAIRIQDVHDEGP